MRVAPLLKVATKAIPVVLLPGSTLNSIGWVSPPMRFFKIIVKGTVRKTAALPADNRILALAEEQGMRGVLVLSRTKTRFISIGHFSKGAVTGAVPPFQKEQVMVLSAMLKRLFRLTTLSILSGLYCLMVNGRATN